MLTTGSVAEKPIPRWSIVASYAAGLHGMVRNLAIDMKPVRVNLVSSGVVDTELWKEMNEGDKANMFRNIEGRVPTGHVGKREFCCFEGELNTGFVACSDSGWKLV